MSYPYTIPNKNIIERVFAITFDKVNVGSCFACEINKCWFLITAKHLITTEYKICYLYYNDSWIDMPIITCFMDLKVDIAAIKISKSFNFQDIELSSKNSIWGQDVYLLGFPYFQLSVKNKNNPENKYPLPFIKKFILSHMQDGIFYLDGHNNHGFSGGPIVFYDFSTKKHKILGVVSGYLNYYGEVKIENSSNNHKYSYAENSGIAVATDIYYVKDLIAQTKP